MTAAWSFGRKIGTAFGVMVALSVLVAGVCFWAVTNVSAQKDQVIADTMNSLVSAEHLRALAEGRAASLRGFLISDKNGSLHEYEADDAAMGLALVELQRHSASGALEPVARSNEAYRVAAREAVELRRTTPTFDAIEAFFTNRAKPAQRGLISDIEAFVALEKVELERATAAANATASSSLTAAAVLVVLCAGIAMALALTLTRSLSRQIGNAVGHVQSSSTELQSAAGQQATAAREQATAMAEISTTIRELLATSRQIAASAQRVSTMASQTANSCMTGDQTVGRARSSIQAIARQVDRIVEHMLELGRKSQQIGLVLDIVSELSEQTNILAINATIEAAGAGEAGRRFSVVADEIRKLADRMGASTKEIRALIEDVRGAVNTTVMATETGSKAAESGAREFASVADQFGQIMSLVGNTTEAAKEIELSTKQQSTAVEQINVAIAGVAQTTREAEVSSGQTSQTANQLTTLSRDLMRVVHPQHAA
jgi:methyl-accepting chemotaxis protein